MAELGFVGTDDEFDQAFEKYKSFMKAVGEASEGGVSYEMIGDDGDDKVPGEANEMAGRMKLSKEDRKRFMSYVESRTGVSLATPSGSYQERAKQVFERHRRYFNKDHYAQVEIAGVGTVNWDGYKLYEKGLFSKGSYMGTYENEKDLKEWSDFGIGQAFTKYDPLELDIRAKGLNLLGFDPNA